MLQQTTVGAVLGRYEKFLARFPNLPALARARHESVLAAWSGLGYYARARNLHAAARAIVARHGGRVPSDAGILRALPGFGEYTAAAVASLAFGARLPAADANVTRVLSRLHAIAGVAGTRRHRDAVSRRAEALLPQRAPGDLTAALMDLGQQICTPRSPACPVCPLFRLCAARAAGAPERFPRRRAKPAPRRVFVAAAVAAERGRALLVPSKDDLLRGLWLFPAAHAASPAAALAALRKTARRLGVVLARGAPIGAARHTIVNRRLEISIYSATRASRRSPLVPRPLPDVRWLTPEELRAAAIPTLTRKIADAAGFRRRSRPRILDAHANRGTADVPARAR